MRVSCPHCGERDRREFTCKGAALARPSGEWGPDWDAYLHLRDNPAGETREFWYHEPCGTWIVVTRDTVTHALSGSVAAAERRG